MFGFGVGLVDRDVLEYVTERYNRTDASHYV